MKRRISHMRWTSSRIIYGICAFLIVVGCPGLASAQDLKPISSSLAAQISASGRKTVAVADFTDLKGNVTELGRFLAEEVSVDLVGAAKGYEIIDRTHLVSILQEHKLASTGLIDPQTARKLGQIAGVDAIVTGTITPLGETIRLSAKVLDTETAKMIAASTTDIPKTPAIDVLMKEGVGGAQTENSATSPDITLNPGPSTSPSPISVRQGDFIFTIRGCWRSVLTGQDRNSEASLSFISYSQTPAQGGFGRQSQIPQSSGNTLDCLGSVSNKSDRRQSLFLGGLVYGKASAAVDDLGNQYEISRVVLGGNGSSQTLEPDLPINFSLSLDGVNPGATRMTIILQTNAGRAAGTVTVRNIVIQKK